MRNLALILGFLACGAVGCGGSEPSAKSPSSAGPATPSGAVATTGGAGGGTVKTFTVSPDSGKVDKVGGSDGALKPDNAPDLVFNADVEGPIAAVFLISTDAKGDPNGEYQADSITGLDELPKDFPLAVRAGMLTAGIGVWEGNRMLNKADGSIEPIGPGPHRLTIYVATTGVLQPGSSNVRLYVMRTTDKAVSRGPVTKM